MCLQKQNEPDHNLCPVDWALLAEAYIIRNTKSLKGINEYKAKVRKEGQANAIILDSGYSSCFSGLEKPV